jgi:hypothetical protein
MKDKFPQVYTHLIKPNFRSYTHSCLEDFKKYPQKTIQQAKKRNTDCDNKFLWSGFHAWEYPQHDVLKVKKGRKTLCYTKNQLLIMNQLGIFPPEVKKKTEKQKIRTMNYNTIPITNLVKSYGCINSLHIESDNIHMYIVSTVPVVNWSLIKPVYWNQPNSKYKIFWRKYDPNWNLFSFNTYIYQLTYKQPFVQPPQIYQYKDVESFKLISNIDSYGEIDLDENKVLVDELTEWLHGRSKELGSLSVWQDLDLKLRTPVLVFRGLLFKLDSLPQKWKNYHVGENIVLSSRNKSMSWSTNYCISKNFSLIDMLSIQRSKEIHIGFILSTTLQPSQILLDTRLLSSDFLISIYKDRLQSEIISMPKETFECKIEEIIVTDSNYQKTGPYTSRYLPIHTAKNL